MLWYKAWLETRVRFLICLLGVSILCPYVVYSDGQQARAGHVAFYFSVVHGGHQALAVLWLIAVTFLTMGGLLREKAVGAAAFTLALPFSRARLTGVRVTVGLIQGVALILTPSMIMWAEEHVMGWPSYPVSQLGFHFVLLFSGGLLFFAVSILIGVLVEGEYTAPLVSFGVVIGTAIALRDPPYQSYSPFRFMGGSEYFDRPTGLLLGPVPWMQAGAYLLVAAILLIVSIEAIEAREF